MTEAQHNEQTTQTAGFISSAFSVHAFAWKKF